MTDAPAGSFDQALWRVDFLYHRLEKALNGFAATFLFMLMWLACAEVFMRYVFNSPIHGQVDFVEILIPTMGFFGLSYCQRLAGHIRMELLLKRLKGRVLWILEFLGTCTTLLICAAMIKGTWDHFLRAYQIGDTSMDAELQVWPAKLIICLGFCVLFFRLWIEFGGYLRLVLNPEATPIGVPTTPTAEDVAQREAELAQDAIPDRASDGNPNG